MHVCMYVCMYVQKQYIYFLYIQALYMKQHRNHTSLQIRKVGISAADDKSLFQTLSLGAHR